MAPDSSTIPDVGGIPDLPTTGDFQYLASSADSTKGYVLSMNYSDMFKVNEYSVTANFEAGFEFKFYSKVSLYTDYESEYYPTLKSGKGDNGFTLCADVAAGLYAHDYLEVAAAPDQSGLNESDEDWIKYLNADAPSLRFKQSGNFTLYLRLYDNGGWLQIYVSPNF
ncbi:MAG: hypothetical protein J1F32_01715 [Erysipelotrichales bacterium]|nr:hypothetical protein [Erysipelotrichales bacterium]